MDEATEELLRRKHPALTALLLEAGEFVAVDDVDAALAEDQANGYPPPSLGSLPVLAISSDDPGGLN